MANIDKYAEFITKQVGREINIGLIEPITEDENLDEYNKFKGVPGQNSRPGSRFKTRAYRPGVQNAKGSLAPGQKEPGAEGENKLQSRAWMAKGIKGSSQKKGDYRPDIDYWGSSRKNLPGKQRLSKTEFTKEEIDLIEKIFGPLEELIGVAYRGEHDPDSFKRLRRSEMADKSKKKGEPFKKKYLNKVAKKHSAAQDK